jgi:cell division protein FtsB
VSVITAGRAGTKPAELPRRNGTKPAELPRKNGTKPAERPQRNGTKPAERKSTRARRNSLSGRSRTTRTTTSTRPKAQPAVRPRSTTAARMPFVLLIVGLLSAGLVTLLLLNTATASGSFTESSLSDRNAKLTLQQQELERTVGALNTPEGLAAAAARLGMVPGGDPVFLVIKPDGSSKVVGTPTPATAPPAPQPPPPTNPPANQNPSHSQSQNQNHSQNQNQPQNHANNQTQPHNQTQPQNQTDPHNQTHTQNQPTHPQDDR